MWHLLLVHEGEQVRVLETLLLLGGHIQVLEEWLRLLIHVHVLEERCTGLGRCCEIRLQE